MSAELTISNIGDLPIHVGDGNYSSKYPKASDFVETGIPFISSGDFLKGRINSTKFRFITEEQHLTLRKGHLKTGDVLVVTRGNSTGDVAWVDDEFDGYNINAQIVLLRSDEKIIHNRFLYYLLSSDEYKDIFVNYSSGSAQPQLPIRALKLIELKFPDYRSQVNIATFFSAIDDKVQLNHQLNQTLEQMAQAIFKSWFVDFEPVKAKIAALEAGGSEDDALLAAMQAISGKYPQQLTQLQTENPEDYTTLRATAELFPAAMQESELGEIPEGWEVTAFANWVELTKGRNITKTTAVPGNIPVVAGGLSPAYYHNKHNVTGPAITVSASGANAGFVNLYYQDIWSSDSSYIDKSKTPYFFTAYTCLKFYQDIIFGMQTGAAQPHIYPKDFERLMIFLPSSELLNIVESDIAAKYQYVFKNQKENTILAETRDTLLPKLLSGELFASDMQTTKTEAVADV